MIDVLERLKPNVAEPSIGFVMLQYDMQLALFRQRAQERPDEYKYDPAGVKN